MADHLLPSTNLRELRMVIEAEILRQPAAATITLRRRDMVMMFCTLAHLEDEVAALEEARAAAERLNRELAIVRAEMERLRLQTIARDLVAARIPSGYRASGGNIVDLTEAMRRERRDVGRPVPPEGGAA